MTMSSEQDSASSRRGKRLASAPDRYFRQILEALPAAIYATDAEGRLTYFNEAAVTLWGRRPTLGEDWWCGSWRLFWPDGSEMSHDECPMAVALKTGKPVRGVEAIAARPDGTRYPFIPFPTPILDVTGRVVGAVNMLIDISDRKQSEEAAQRLAAIVESSEDAIVSKDLNGVITSWNASAERIFGYSASEAIGKSVTMLIPSDHVDEEPRLLERIRRGERIDHYETTRRRKDGSLIPISLTISPIRNAKGTIVGASKIARDNTERKRADERQTILVGEMRHRAGNLAALINALANQSRPKDSPEVDQYVERFLGRMRSVLAAGELVLASSSRTPDVVDIFRSALKPFVDMYAPGRILISGPSLAVSEQVGAGLALAIHELATNAVKYGALSTDEGSVSLSCKVTQEDFGKRVEIEWLERGGPDVRAPERPGFGTRVIRSTLSGAKDGTVSLDFAPQGLCCRMRFLAAEKAG
jgi:two-component system, chemotaxis family, CheB/CheR fusion protein